jgi:HAMP domain-containing protein
MFSNLKLNAKLNLLLVSIFFFTVIVSGFVLSIILQRNAESIVSNKALLLIETMSSVRHYTSTQVNPELVDRLETESQFLPQTVPGYSAREVFEELRTRKEYNDFFYKEATLNPTNLRDKADSFEAKLVETFQQQPELKEEVGFRSFASGKLFYIARPISVSKESCLRCHSSPDLAPKSQLATYGDKNGFGWKLNEIVGAQMISVPASKVFEEARNLQIIVIAVISFFFIMAMILINLFLKYTVNNPLKQMAQLAKQISTGDMSGEFPQKSKDEIGILAASLNRMKVSLKMAMDMLNSDSQE